MQPEIHTSMRANPGPTPDPGDFISLSLFSYEMGTAVIPTSDRPDGMKHEHSPVYVADA